MAFVGEDGNLDLAALLDLVEAAGLRVLALELVPVSQRTSLRSGCLPTDRMRPWTLPLLMPRLRQSVLE